MNFEALPTLNEDWCPRFGRPRHRRTRPRDDQQPTPSHHPYRRNSTESKNQTSNSMGDPRTSGIMGRQDLDIVATSSQPFSSPPMCRVRPPSSHTTIHRMRWKIKNRPAPNQQDVVFWSSNDQEHRIEHQRHPELPEAAAQDSASPTLVPPSWRLLGGSLGRETTSPKIKEARPRFPLVGPKSRR